MGGLVTEPTRDTFTFAEMRISLTAFAIWLNQHPNTYLTLHKDCEVHIVDQFIEETTGD